MVDVVRVLYFHQYFGTPSGSGGTRSYELAQRLLKAGHQVTMVCGNTKDRGATGLQGPYLKGRREGLVDGIHVIELSLPYSNSLGFVQRAIIFLRFATSSIGIALRHDYDLLFATTTPLTAGIPGIFARWLRRKPFVFEVRDLWPELPREMGVIRNPLILWALGALEWVSYRSAHRLVGLAPGIVKGIERLGVPSASVAMIPNGCDLEIFGNPETAWRPESVGDGDLMAVFTGAHGMANGLDAVVDAGAELKRRGRKDIKLVLIGDGMLKPKLQQRVAQEGLGEIVIFHDPVPKRRLAGLLAAADIGMQILANVPAFYYGTSPNKFFDYLASGLPVLTNYPGWVADLATENGCGWAVPPENPAAFADVLERASGDKTELRRMGEKSRSLAQREFDRNLLGDRFVAWLEGAL